MKRIFQKLSGLIGKIPPRSRGGKLIRNMVCILLLCVVIWWCFGMPALSVRHAFRRAERANLLEPSEILAVIPGSAVELPEEEPWDGSLSDDWSIRQALKRTRAFVVGSTGDYLLCFGWEEPLSDGIYAVYRESEWLNVTQKTGEVTVTRTASYGNGLETVGELLFVQTDLPGAHRIVLETRGFSGRYRYEQQEWDYYTNWCQGTGAVQENGVFVVPVFQCTDAEPAEEGIDGSFDKCEVHVVITDAQGETIYDETLIV